MTRFQDATGKTPDNRHLPNSHSAAVQEAKRLEKMQSIASSHRTSGAIQRPPAPSQDAER